MHLAVADPVYLGQSHFYPEHAESHVWDRTETHLDLLADLQANYDGWVYACTTPMIKLLLPDAPEGTRMGVWVKRPARGRRPNVRVGYGHEFVLFQQPPGRRGGQAHMARTDVLLAP